MLEVDTQYPSLTSSKSHHSPHIANPTAHLAPDSLSPDEPELPPLPPRRANKKRAIDEVLCVNNNISSDPPLFSSDDASSTIENYSYQRPKRLHHGTWWSSARGGSSLRSDGKNVEVENRRAFTRNFDSGVWMGSDSSCVSGGDGVEDVEVHAGNELETIGGGTKRRKILRIRDVSPHPVSAEDRMGERHKTALKLVERAVIVSDPSIDLSSMYMSSLPWRILEPLRTFTPEPHAQYQPFASGLRLSLAHNELTDLPNELFTLKGLYSLSLRNNQLTEISPAISHLAPDLCELNLSVNNLKYLPVEIKDLIRGTPGRFMLRLADNSFFQPVLQSEAHSQIGKEKKDEIQSNSETLTKEESMATRGDPIASDGTSDRHGTLYASRVAFIDICGVSINGPVPSRINEAEPANPSGLRGDPQASDRAPSLYEIALRSSSAYPVEQLLDCLGDEGPPTMVRNLETAAEQFKAGFQACSICSRNFSIARTEWIEWQMLADTVVPLLHRGCTWACVPRLEHLNPSSKNCGWIDAKS